jgi:hypothetical protein
MSTVSSMIWRHAACDSMLVTVLGFSLYAVYAVLNVVAIST